MASASGTTTKTRGFSSSMRSKKWGDDGKASADCWSCNFIFAGHGRNFSMHLDHFLESRKKRSRAASMRILIPGQPIPKLRARHARKGKKTMTYDPQEKEKRLVQQEMRKQKTYRFAFAAPVFVEMTFGVKIQKNGHATQKNAKLWGFEKPTQRPDLDN